jgi:hypothetical protein
VRVPHLSPTTLTTDEQRLILRATAANVRDHCQPPDRRSDLARSLLYSGGYSAPELD